MRVLAIVLGVVVGLSAAAPVYADHAAEPGGTFVDDDGSVHEGSIEAMFESGVTRGCSTDSPLFCPDDPVTRDQMAAFLTRAFGLSAGDPDKFEDTKESVFAADIGALAAAGISMGCNPPANTRFCPDDEVDRGQMAAFLARALQLDGTPEASFTDTAGSVFEVEIGRLADAGVTRGCDPPDNHRFCPDAPVSRAEMATFLARATGLDVPSVPTRRAVLEITSRDGWGAADWKPGFREHALEQLTVHHSGSPVSSVWGPPAFRGWQSYHFSLGWPDLAYHYIVGRDGAVYEARPAWAAGDTATDYDPTGHFLVVVEGDYDQMEPTAGQIEALARTLAWASMAYGIDPETIAGHRDHAATTCPGDSLHTLIADGSLTRRVIEILHAGGVTVSVG